MALESMTGYSRSEGTLKLGVSDQIWGWTWELRSVNSKGFDLRSKLPPGRQSLELSTKKEIMTQITRGVITAHLIRKEDLTDKKIIINERFLGQLCDIHQRLMRPSLNSRFTSSLQLFTRPARHLSQHPIPPYSASHSIRLSL